MRVLFLDRDGTLIREPYDYRIDRLDKLAFLPMVIRSLARLQEAGWRLVLVSNQDGLGKEDFPQEDFDLVQAKMIEIFDGEGIHFDAVYIDKHDEADNHPMRKPNPGMVLDFAAQHPSLDLSGCYVIGDRKTDAWLAHNAGCRSITIKDPQSRDGDERIPHIAPAPTVTFTSWVEVADYILREG